MATLAKAQAPAVSHDLTLAHRLTTVVLLLAAIAAAGGLFWSGLYRDPLWSSAQMRGQDAVTLLTLPCVAIAQAYARRGSARGLFAWIGLLGYLWYTYTLASFGYFFNEFFLLYVTLFALSSITMISLLTNIDAEALKRRFSEGHPRGPVIGYVAFIGFILLLMWIAQMVPFFISGTLPQPIVAAETPTSGIYVMDLGIVVPTALIAATWLKQRRAWGYVMAGFLLFKAITMGSALLSMTLFSYLAGVDVDLGLGVVWVVLTASGLLMTVWFLRYCRD